MSPISILLALMCVLCYTGQTFFSKLFSVHYTGQSSLATPVFASVYGLFTGLVTLAYNGFSMNVSAPTLWLGLLNGVVLFLFNLSSINASRSGPFAFQSILMLFGNILLPLGFCLIFWGDSLTGLKLTGICIMLLSCVLFNHRGLRFEGVRRGYFFWVGLLFLTNGLYGIVLDSQQRILAAAQRNEMIVITFLTSALISLGYLLILRGPRIASAFRLSRKCWCFTLGSSVCAAAAVNTLMLTMHYVPSSVLYTVSNGGVLICTTSLGVLVLKEKLNPFQIAGIAVAVFSLILLSL